MCRIMLLKWPIAVEAQSPVAVKTEVQRQHISKDLLEYGFEKAREMGFQVVLVEGDPGNYNPCGFVDYAFYDALQEE